MYPRSVYKTAVRTLGAPPRPAPAAAANPCASLLLWCRGLLGAALTGYPAGRSVDCGFDLRARSFPAERGRTLGAIMRT
jgi:hypothetical protein